MTRASGQAIDVTKQHEEIQYLADDLECINQLRNPDPNDPLSKFPTVETPAELDARELKVLRQLAAVAITLVRK